MSPDGSNPLGDNQGFEEVEENPIKLNDVKVKKKKKKTKLINLIKKKN